MSFSRAFGSNLAARRWRIASGACGWGCARLWCGRRSPLCLSQPGAGAHREPAGVHLVGVRGTIRGCSMPHRIFSRRCPPSGERCARRGRWTCRGNGWGGGCVGAGERLPYWAGVATTAPTPPACRVSTCRLRSMPCSPTKDPLPSWGEPALVHPALAAGVGIPGAGRFRTGALCPRL